MKTQHFVLIVFLTLLLSGSLRAQTDRGAFVEAISNEHSSFPIRIVVDRQDGIYARNDLMTIGVHSSEDGFLYVLYRDAAGQVSMLFPNRFQQDNAIKKGEPAVVPSEADKFRIRIDAPFGDERIKVVVSKKPIEGLDIEQFFKAEATPINEATAEALLKGLDVKNLAPSEWSEHDVRIKTVAVRDATPSKADRFALLVGVDIYKNLPPNKYLPPCKPDVENMARFFTDQCGIPAEQTFCLIGKEATLHGVAAMLRDKLPEITKPGDTIFLYWSGHGTRDHETGREFLLPYDTDDDESTLLGDDTLGRWVLNLSGRKILVLIDTCFSGGMGSHAKATSNSRDWTPLRFDFLRRAISKDIGQKDAALIGACSATEESHVRGERDMSVFTYFLLEAASEIKDPLTHVRWYESTKPKVDEYMKRTYPDKRQTTVMQDDMTEPLVVKP